MFFLTLLVVATSGAQNKPAIAPAAKEFKDLDSLVNALPLPTVNPLSLDSVLLFTAVPLSCVDELQSKPAARPYFWQPSYKIVDGMNKSRAFYSCND